MMDDGNGFNCGGSGDFQSHDGFIRGMSGTGEEFYTHIGPAGSTSHEELGVQGCSKEASTELCADLLVEVFSFLGNVQLYEVMSVSRDWRKAVIEGSALWRKVHVVQTFDAEAVWVEGMGGKEGRGLKEERGLEVLLQVFRVVEVLKVTSFYGNNISRMMLLKGGLGPNLASLTLCAR